MVAPVKDIVGDEVRHSSAFSAWVKDDSPKGERPIRRRPFAIAFKMILTMAIGRSVRWEHEENHN